MRGVVRWETDEICYCCGIGAGGRDRFVGPEMGERGGGWGKKVYQELDFQFEPVRAYYITLFFIAVLWTRVMPISLFDGPGRRDAERERVCDVRPVHAWPLLPGGTHTELPRILSSAPFRPPSPPPPTSSTPPSVPPPPLTADDHAAGIATSYPTTATAAAAAAAMINWWREGGGLVFFAIHYTTLSYTTLLYSHNHPHPPHQPPPRRLAVRTHRRHHAEPDTSRPPTRPRTCDSGAARWRAAGPDARQASGAACRSSSSSSSTCDTDLAKWEGSGDLCRLATEDYAPRTPPPASHAAPASPSPPERRQPPSAAPAS